VRVAYDEPCHLLHAQKISAAPRAVLDALPAVTRVPLADADTCCGSAGIYSVVQPELAGRIANRKIEAIQQSGAEVVVTGNPGCLMQIESGLREAGLSVKVMHPIELVASRYR
jgi:glycolate oxidase iron-sulfur subunit